MPACDLKLNLEVPDAKAFTLEFSKFMATTLGKPEAYISVLVTTVPLLTFNGTFDPAFNLVITSLDNINPEKNDKYSKAIAAFLKEKLGLADNRGYIVFSDPGRANLGYQATTFATIFGK